MVSSFGLAAFWFIGGAHARSTPSKDLLDRRATPTTATSRILQDGLESLQERLQQQHETKPQSMLDDRFEMVGDVAIITHAEAGYAVPITPDFSRPHGEEIVVSQARVPL